MKHLVTDAQAQELRTFGCISTDEGGRLVIMTNPEDIYSDMLDTREALIEALERVLDGDPQGVLPFSAARGLLFKLKGKSG